MSGRRLRRRDRGVLAVAGVLVVAAVPTGVVVAQSGKESWEEQQPGQPLHHAQPPRTSVPESVMSGTTEAGQRYVVKVSDAADGLKCIDVEYGTMEDGSEPKGPARLVGGGFCFAPDERTVVASVKQLFVDSNTGEITKRPQRFAYGFAGEGASEVKVVGPGGRDVALKVSKQLAGGLRAFAGSIPATAVPGRAEVVALDSRGAGIGRHDLTFAALERREGPGPNGTLPDPGAHP
jgi:hypothetical protein